MLVEGAPDPRWPSSGAQRRRSLAGLRRLGWVRVTLVADGARCEAIGTGHRRPVVRLIPLSTAAGLIASGVPAVVHRSDEALAVGHELAAARTNVQAQKA